MSSNHKSHMRMFNGHLKLDEASLKKIFMLQLNSIFCVKEHLLQYLPTLIERASFRDLKNAILENVEDIKLQVLRMENMYVMLNETYSPNKCLAIKSITLEAYLATKYMQLSNLESDLTMLIHLRTIEGIEITCFQVLCDIAASLPGEELELMLQQNLDMAKDSSQLYELITQEYLN